MAIEVDEKLFGKLSRKLINEVSREEVIVKNGDKKIAIIVNYEKYKTLKEKLRELEDFLWALKAEEILKDAEFVELDPTQL